MICPMFTDDFPAYDDTGQRGRDDVTPDADSRPADSWWFLGAFVMIQRVSFFFFNVGIQHVKTIDAINVVFYHVKTC